NEVTISTSWPQRASSVARNRRRVCAPPISGGKYCVRIKKRMDSEKMLQRLKSRNGIDLRPLFEGNRTEQDAGRKRARLAKNKFAAFLAKLFGIEDSADAKVGAVPDVAMTILHAVQKPFVFRGVEAKFGFAEADFFR